MTPRWRVETTDEFDRDFKKLDRAVQRRVLAYLHGVESLEGSRQRGKGLTANHAGDSETSLPSRSRCSTDLFS